ncbi:hypothetical protein C5L25_000414 [Secundilactobacillus silagei JCM 19001]|uniref:LytR family transcriptional regulator n=3 Tax=Secundilactobacillus silagei TaxID=1293415 RepID=A0A1Z5IG27_9LACO|nr:hypothetical protein C5L25_000414 [Secundilactobacillus silagei JCM 19001]GAX00636.1 LytR family transcriptional regulator [Secundilactobacillus silagei JCM 19001]
MLQSGEVDYMSQIDKQKMTNRGHHSRKIRRRVRNSVLGFVAVLAVGFVGFTAYGYHTVSTTTKAMYKPSGATKERNASAVIKDKKPVSILMVGTDSNKINRTGSLMLVTLNPKTNKTVEMSLPDNLKVNLPGYKQYSPATVNQAYSYGGTKETVKTVQSYLKVPVDYYMAVNMNGLDKTVNKVGGVNVTSPQTFTNNGKTFNAGQNYHLNGANTGKFLSLRESDTKGYNQQQARQRAVLSALLKKSTSYKTVLNKSYLNTLGDEMQTDLTEKQMTQLALHYRHADQNVKSETVNAKSQKLGGKNFEVAPTSERTRAVNAVRQNLGF